MCSCEFNFTCAKCAPRRKVDLGDLDWRELEQERWEDLISRPDFDRAAE